MNKLLSGIALACGLLVLSAGAQAGKGITYTLYTDTSWMAPVQIGTQSYTGQVVLSFQSDTSHAHLAQENGVYVYRNDTGTATITISGASKQVSATILPGQVYVRYDPVNGVLGFGSVAGGIYYPVAINCSQCVGYNGTVGALADIAATPANETAYPKDILSYATELQGPAFLTGLVNYYDGATGAPLLPNPVPVIRTSLGPMVFGTTPAQTGGARAIFTATLD